jgi:hypothetical protein
MPHKNLIVYIVSPLIYLGFFIGNNSHIGTISVKVVMVDDFPICSDSCTKVWSTLNVKITRG